MKDIYDPGRPFVLKSPYGDRADPFKSNSREFHAGVDFSAPAGTPIPAATSGVVVYSGRNSGFGNTVVVRNATGDYSLYAHMQDGDRATVRQHVWPGDTIGQVGSTGERAKGSHLHYSVLPANAREAIENANLPHDGGPIGIRVNRANTIDPAEYDPQPYLDQSQQASEILSGLDGKSPLNGMPAPASLTPSGQRSDVPDDVTSASVTADDQTAPADIPFRRLVNLSSPALIAAPSLAPAPSPPLLGIFSGQPMRDYPVSSSIFQTNDQSSPDDDELFQRWMRFVDG
ncbi:M23 family metallopeptidase [Bradyrhizobium sp.]|uniref:M23 family metallopeptidase n=1 Tax=Bradyrhizobium sp. TaxID=376 RepID=UPI00261DDE85|nr:M23 family metallopeptidase [Bradyrhizobium sp.]